MSCTLWRRSSTVSRSLEGSTKDARLVALAGSILYSPLLAFGCLGETMQTHTNKTTNIECICGSRLWIVAFQVVQLGCCTHEKSIVLGLEATLNARVLTLLLATENNAVRIKSNPWISITYKRRCCDPITPYVYLAQQNKQCRFPANRLFS